MENEYEIEAKIDLAYAADEARIRVSDATSSVRIAELRIPLAIFGELVASHSDQRATARIFLAGIDNWGKRRESTRFCVPGVNPRTWEQRREIVGAWLDAHDDPDVADGHWLINYDDPDGSTRSNGLNRHRIVRGVDGAPDAYEFVAVRYVDDDEEPRPDEVRARLA